MVPSECLSARALRCSRAVRVPQCQGTQMQWCRSECPGPGPGTALWQCLWQVLWPIFSTFTAPRRALEIAGDMYIWLFWLKTLTLLLRHCGVSPKIRSKITNYYSFENNFALIPQLFFTWLTAWKFFWSGFSGEKIIYQRIFLLNR